MPTCSPKCNPPLPAPCSLACLHEIQNVTQFFIRFGFWYVPRVGCWYVLGLVFGTLRVLFFWYVLGPVVGTFRGTVVGTSWFLARSQGQFLVRFVKFFGTIRGWIVGAFWGLFFVCCLLFVVRCLLVVCCLLSVVCCVELFAVCCLLFVVCWQLVACCLLFPNPKPWGA